MENLGRTEIVQELAEIGQEPPSRYIQSDQERPATSPAPTAAIPSFHLQDLILVDSDDKISTLRSVLQSWGMIQIIGHGIPVSLLDEVYNAARQFFQLPSDEKLKYNNLIDGKLFQFEGYGNDWVRNEDQLLNWNDRLYLLVQPEDRRNLALWPNYPSSFRDILHEFALKTREIGDIFLMATAKVLGLHEGYFIGEFGDKGQVDARFNIYPCCQRPDLVFGVHPHSDSSLITILLLDKDVEGLQMLKDGKWVNIQTNDHALLVLMGDEMEIMCNGIFKGPVHRVVTNTERDRVTVAMFYTMEPDKELKPTASLVDESRPGLYRKIKTKDYIDIFVKNYAEGKRTIDWIKTSYVDP